MTKSISRRGLLIGTGASVAASFSLSASSSASNLDGRKNRDGRDRSAKPCWSIAPLSVIDMHPIDMIAAASAAGCDAVGFRFAPLTDAEPSFPFLTDHRFVRSVATALADHGIRGWDTEVVYLREADAPSDYQRWLEVAAELGLTSLLLQTPDKDLSRVTDKVAELCLLASPYGLRCDIEFVSWTDNPSLSNTAKIVHGANQPNLGIIVDVLHLTRSGGKASEIAALPPEWFAAMHVNDVQSAPAPSVEERIAEARGNRLLPGDGVADLRGIVAALPDNIVYSIELPNLESRLVRGDRGHVEQIYTRSRSDFTKVASP